MEFWSRNKKYLILGTLFIATLIIWAAVFDAAPSHLLKVAVLDIGQGDSIYIESPTGVQILIDGGPDNSVLRELPKVMPAFDRSLDAIIETHPHADHITGFLDLLKRYQVGAFIEPGVLYDSLVYRTLLKEAADAKIPHYLARRGMVLDLGAGAELDVLYPDSDVTHLATKDVHEGNVVAHLVYGKTSILLTGDAPKDVEDYLMRISSSRALQSDILKVGHHGSAGSTGEVFLAEVNPRVAIISVDTHNRYGHPTQVTLNNLLQHNVKTLRTDQEGTIEFDSNGETFIRSK